jgi:predicted alpha/beta-fold hydrolase
LEGDASRHYVTGMANLFVQQGFDALGWNCRSCSGEINRLPRFYHHGDAGDLRTVIEHAITGKQYQRIVLVGFSMGGSLTLRVLSENPAWVPAEVKGAVAFSVPCDLYSGVLQLMKPGNQFYTQRFLRKLGKKIKIKSVRFPTIINDHQYHRISNFIEFDNRYTAPLHGYADAIDFYRKASVKPLLHQLQIPALLVQAANDPFLAPECFCEELAKDHAYLHLEITERGGHCGFLQAGSVHTWAEKRALEFVTTQVLTS